MAEIVKVERKIYGKNTFNSVVDTNFNQLVPNENSTPVAPETTLASFFDNYNTIFYDIPQSGSVQSHLELINRSSEYLGISFEDLQQEIATLREENVALKKQLYSFSNPGNK